MEHTTTQDNLLKGIDVTGIIKKSIRGSLPKQEQTVSEAYVAQPKVYPQVSEMLSAKAKAAHTELYKGHIEAMNRVSAELDGVEKNNANSQHSSFRSLKLDETFNVNATYLHELHFANTCDPQSEIYVDQKAFIKLQSTHGDFDSWQREFMACAMSCGEGWVITGWNLFLKRFVTTMVSNNSQDVMVGLVPLIVLDCHEHAYYRDYLFDRKSYVVAMMRNLAWNIIEDRFVKAEALASVYR